jgi:hypothetical protein
MTVVAEPAGPATPSPARLSPFQRTGRIFARPTAAWDDLKERGQWLFPLMIAILVWVVLQTLVFEPVTLPTMLEQWSHAVEEGRMEPAQAAKAEEFFTGNPAARWTVIVPQVIVFPIVMLIQALVVWFGAGFVLGTPFRFRHAFDVVCWTGLVKIPETILFYALAWQQGSVRSVHLGLGLLVPESESPGKLLTGLTTFLDFIGPFSAWWIVVGVLGVSVLSGAPRRNVAWVMIAMYLAFGVLLAAVNAFFNPGA